MSILKMIKANQADLLNIASWLYAAGGVIATACDYDKTAAGFVMASMVAHYSARQVARMEVLNNARAGAAAAANITAKYKVGQCDDEVVLTPEEKIEAIILAITTDPSYMPDESWLSLANSLNPDDAVQSYRAWCMQEELTNRLYEVMHPECAS